MTERSIRRHAPRVRLPRRVLVSHRRDQFEFVAILIAIALAATYLAAFFLVFCGSLIGPPPGYFLSMAIMAALFSGAAAIVLIRGVLVLRSGRKSLGLVYMALSVILFVSSMLRIVMVELRAYNPCSLP